MPRRSRATRSAIAVAGLNRLAQSDLIDRVGLRKPAEQVVFTVTRSGFKTVDHRQPHLRPAGQEGRSPASARRRRARRASST